MTINRSASLRRSVDGIGDLLAREDRTPSCEFRRLTAGDPPKHRSDGHPEPGHVALSEDVARHNLAGREHVSRWRTLGHENARLLVDSDPEVREGDARPKRVAIKWRPVNRYRPVALWRSEPLGATVVE